MLAAAREIRIGGQQIATTPLLVPSFSSKGFPEVDSIVQALSSTITEWALFSAYDISHGFIREVPTSPQFLILDSGGYESSSAAELSDTRMNVYRELDWTADCHVKVLDQWNATQPTLAVSYDHPKARADVPTQIARAKSLFAGRHFGKEVLIKPDTEDARRINVDAVITHAHEFRDFDVIGFTETELGYSIFNRMKSLAKIRKALSNVGLNTPIHVFGSLDTISTPLYFLAGADIFDGLTWLRYYYGETAAVYSRNAAAQNFGIRVNDVDVPPMIWYKNYQTLLNVQLAMKRYLKEQKFHVFNGDAEFFERSSMELMAEV